MTNDEKRGLLYEYCGRTDCRVCKLRGKWNSISNEDRECLCVSGASEEELNRAVELVCCKESVNHPSHYNQGKYECIDVMVETFGREAAKNFCLLNAFKYVWRTGEKNGREDIEKAVWYLNKYLELGKGEENEGNTSGTGA